MCTFTACQWDLATAPPSTFAPEGLDTDQWLATDKLMGATQACLTVRHVDGFALWPTATTNYSVAASSWRGGKGDVVADFVASARRHGISPCLYVILGFNVHANHSGVPAPEYLDEQVVVLTELLTRYGTIDRLWWDNFAIGCCQPVWPPGPDGGGFYCPGGGTTSGPGPACPAWQVLIDVVRALSPTTAIIPGPDGCLVNGESLGGTYPLYHASSMPQSSYSCVDAGAPVAGSTFTVPESDLTMLMPGDNWFWNPGLPFLNASAILDQFNVKHEQGANLILNVPPNASGVIPAEYVAELAAFAAARAATFDHPVASLAAAVSGTCGAGGSLTFTVPVPPGAVFDTLVTAEDLGGGQAIGAYGVEAHDAASGAWRPLRVHAVTVGARLLDSVGRQTGVDALRFNCTADLAPPAPVSFVNAAGACLSIPDGESFPCWSGGVGPFHLCPLVAASCAGAAARWWQRGGDGGGLFALDVDPTAMLNLDCNTCTAGTHAKLILASTPTGVAFDAALGQLAVPTCPGMCLTNGTAAGALPSCAGIEPWTPTQVHLAPCVDAATRGWARVLSPGVSTPLVATVREFGAFLAVSP